MEKLQYFIQAITINNDMELIPEDSGLTQTSIVVGIMIAIVLIILWKEGKGDD